MRIIVAGGGKVGRAITTRLAKEDCDLTLIDLKRSVLDASLEQEDVMVLQGNAASMPILRAAEIQNADLLIAATSADEVNLLSCLTARSMNKNLHTVARVRNPDYAEQQTAMRTELGLSMTVNPEYDAAVEIYRLLQYPGFLKRDAFARGRIEIVELKISEGGKLDGVMLRNLNEACGVKVLVCAILRDGKVTIPSGNHQLKAGDSIFVTAKSATLAELIKNLGLVSQRVRHVIIVGGGRLGYHLATILLQNGIKVKLIERDETVAGQLAMQLPKASVICGEGCNQQLLDSEGIASTDAIVTLTGIDEENLIVSMYAAKLGVPKVITRVDRMENTEMFCDMGAGSIISPKEICASKVVRFVRAASNKSGSMIALYRIANNLAEAMEFFVTADVKYTGVPLKDVPLRQNCLIAGIIRGPETIIPSGGDSFLPDDRVVIVTTGEVAVKDMNDIFAK